jgi:Domain of unknown function (DUF4190)
VICPNCGHDNPEARKYCRACTKPLSVGAWPTRATTAASSPTESRTTVSTNVNKMAVASLISGFLALLPPFGLAAIALGHLSRSQIAKSQGREKGTGIAFAGLILGYGQLAIFATLFLGLLGIVSDIRQDLARHPDTRLALLDRIAHGDPYNVTPGRTARQEQTAIQALHLIQAKEAEYLAAHPEEGYACQMYKLGRTVGKDANSQTELDALLVQSHYDSKFISCGQIPGAVPGTSSPPFYLVLSVPRSDGNGPEAPVFCLDHANGIERYPSEQSGNAIAAIATSRSDQCPLTGTPVN